MIMLTLGAGGVYQAAHGPHRRHGARISLANRTKGRSGVLG